MALKQNEKRAIIEVAHLQQRWVDAGFNPSESMKEVALWGPQFVQVLEEWHPDTDHTIKTFAQIRQDVAGLRE